MLVLTFANVMYCTWRGIEGILTALKNESNWIWKIWCCLNLLLVPALPFISAAYLLYLEIQLKHQKEWYDNFGKEEA